ncbi:MAG: ISNCY family transposase [bacterium]|nr:ISNCY family transposase [bacterium]
MTTNFTDKERLKLKVIKDLLQKKIKTKQASKILNLSTRQVRRLKNRFKKDEITAVVHGLKGKVGNHRIDDTIKNKVIKTIKQKYPDFKPTFATEKLQEKQIAVPTSQTVRIWMTEAGLWKTRKQKQAEYHSWRPRKDHFGEMQQFDGSYHLWFENRYKDNKGDSIEVCLLASIDDATGKITHMSFEENEGVVAVFNFWKTYVLTAGKPLIIYLDKFSTYKINHKAAVDNKDLITQFQRVCQSLDILLINAHSAQAKGRVERLFGTLQDRLVKEMRLAKINNPKNGNKFLKDIFIPKFNRQFSVIPKSEGDVHRKLNSNEEKKLNSIFSIYDRRKINNDFTIQFKNNYYQLEEIQPTTVRPKETVIIETWLDKTLHIILKDFDLNYFLIKERPKKMKIAPAILTTHKLNWIPPFNHPWRQRSRLTIKKRRLKADISNLV